jgi:hypothetical protein
MAKLHEEVIVLKISKLLKDSEEAPQMLADNEILTSLEQVTAELLGSGVMIEFERA